MEKLKNATPVSKKATTEKPAKPKRKPAVAKPSIAKPAPKHNATTRATTRPTTTEQRNAKKATPKKTKANRKKGTPDGGGSYVRPKPVGTPDNPTKRGRTFATIDWGNVKKLLASGMSGASVAQTIGIDKSVLYRRCQDEHGVTFQYYRQKARAGGVDLLRAKQHELAMKGDRAMLIWLSKNYLGQTETGALDSDVFNSDFDGFTYTPVETPETPNRPNNTDEGE